MKHERGAVGAQSRRRSRRRRSRASPAPPRSPCARPDQGQAHRGVAGGGVDDGLAGPQARRCARPPSTIESAVRSFTEPPGLNHSHLPQSSTPLAARRRAAAARAACGRSPRGSRPGTADARARAALTPSPRPAASKWQDHSRSLSSRIVGASPQTAQRRVAPHAVLAERHGQRVVGQQAPAQRPAAAQQDLQGLGGLDQPDHARAARRARPPRRRRAPAPAAWARGRGSGSRDRRRARTRRPGRRSGRCCRRPRSSASSTAASFTRYLVEKLSQPSRITS